MVNFIWLGMITLGTVFAMFNGRLEQVGQAVFFSAELAVEVILGLVGVMGFWLGMAKLIERSGLIRLLVKLLRPLTQALFPSVPPNHPAFGAILLNITANFLGLGNAATPFGLKAMRHLAKLNSESPEASDAMCTFLALNTACITLMPTMVIALRAGQGSAAPAEIVGTTLVATIFGTLVALSVDGLFRILSRRGRNGR